MAKQIPENRLYIEQITPDIIDYISYTLINNGESIETVNSIGKKYNDAACRYGYYNVNGELIKANGKVRMEFYRNETAIRI